TFGLAPGYCARTMTDGDTTSGYSEIGKAPTDIAPAMKMSTDSTPAKTGLSMKNLERFMARSGGWSSRHPCGPAGGRHRARLSAVPSFRHLEVGAGRDPCRCRSTTALDFLRTLRHADSGWDDGRARVLPTAP